jgi:peptidoglycan pentaglycine glycine transferase (the first glycine)
MPEISSQQWDEWISSDPDAHLLQSAAWGELKAAFGWERVYVTTGAVGAQVLFRRLPGGLRIGYIPKGPVGPLQPKEWQQLWLELNAICLRKRSIFLKVEPDAWESDLPQIQSAFQGFIPSDPIQPRRTIVLELTGNSSSWLERMKQKTRYNIRLAEKKEVCVKPTDDLQSFHQMALETGQRDGFHVHSLEYYQKSYDLFHLHGNCELFTATYQDRPLAALLVFAHGHRAWYLHGVSGSEERNRMPAYALQWEAMKWASERGCTQYDLWGVPDEDEPILEAQFENRSDGLWGVYRFKRGYGGQLLRTAGAWDRVYYPGLYRIYRWWMHRQKGQPAG